MALYRVTLKKCIYEDIYVSAENIKEAREFMDSKDNWNNGDVDFTDYQFDSIRKVERPIDVDEEWVDDNVWCFGFQNEDVNVWQAFYGISDKELSEVSDEDIDIAVDNYIKKIEKAKNRFLKERDIIKNLRLQIK